MATDDNEVTAALRGFAAGRFDEWRGLPPCDAAGLAAAFNARIEEPGDGRLSGRRTHFRTYHAAAQAQPLWAWFDDDDRAILITLIEPLLVTPVPALLARMGAPEEKIEPGVGPHADAYQWVWGRRGLTLFVREWLDAGPEIARACGFAPTTVEDYLERLGARDRTRYL